MGFNPRVPCGTRLWRSPGFRMPWRFQSTRPVRDATRTHRLDVRITVFQSTRPVRDATLPGDSTCLATLFQSTRPVRDATGNYLYVFYETQGFNPRVPCGTRQPR